MHYQTLVQGPVLCGANVVPTSQVRGPPWCYYAGNENVRDWGDLQ